MKEIWKPIAGYEGFYEVSDQGRVKSLARVIDGDFGTKGGRRFARERILRPSRNRYCNVSLAMNGKSKSVAVHSLVLNSFIGQCPEGMVCRHFPDRDTSNNTVANLQWGTPTQNQEDRFIHGTDDKGKPKKRKLTKIVEGEIAEKYARQNVTQRQLAIQYGISLALVNHIVNNKTRSGDKNG